MATNCPQQVKPRACRSALCWRTADSNSKREKSWRTCENILQNRFKADPPEFEIGFQGPNLNLSEAQLFRVIICDRNLDKSELAYAPAVGEELTFPNDSPP